LFLFSKFPEPIQTLGLYEPMIAGTLIFPEQYMGKIITLCEVSKENSLL